MARKFTLVDVDDLETQEGIESFLDHLEELGFKFTERGQEKANTPGQKKQGRKGGSKVSRAAPKAGDAP